MRVLKEPIHSERFEKAYKRHQYMEILKYTQVHVTNYSVLGQGMGFDLDPILLPRNDSSDHSALGSDF